MVEMYGQLWTASYGDSPTELWERVISHVGWAGFFAHPFASMNYPRGHKNVDHSTRLCYWQQEK